MYKLRIEQLYIMTSTQGIRGVVVMPTKPSTFCKEKWVQAMTSVACPSKLDMAPDGTGPASDIMRRSCTAGH
jgi:hypothetical protein